MKEGTLFKGETMPKILLTSIIAMFAIMPVFAETTKSEDGGLTCDASGVGATTANARMKASWTPNKYTLQWYDDEKSTTPLTVQSAAQTCNYGANLVLPSTNPPKLGYTFIGWELEEKTDCGLSSLDTNINATEDATHVRWKPINGDSGYTMTQHGWTENSSDLSNGEWAVLFSYGEVKGTSLCSQTNGTTATTGTPDESGSGDTRSCWCKITTYTPSGGNQCEQTSQWVLDITWPTSYDATYCTNYCTQACANAIQDGQIYRAAMFGASQQKKE